MNRFWPHSHHSKRLLILSALLIFGLVETGRSIVGLRHSNRVQSLKEEGVEGLDGILLYAGDSTPFLVGVMLFGIIAAIGFYRRPYSLLLGMAVLFASLFLNEIHEAMFGSPMRGMYIQGAVLFGMLLARGAYRFSMGGDAQEGKQAQLCQWAGLAMLAGYYCSGGLSKILASGLEWMGPETLRSIVVVHSAGGADPALAGWAIDNPWVCQSMAIGTVVLETGAFLMLFGDGLRRWWAFGLLAMHISIGLVTGTIWYISPMVLLLGALLPFDTHADPARFRFSSFARPVVALTGLLCLIAWVSPYSPQERFEDRVAGERGTDEKAGRSLLEAGNLQVGMSVSGESVISEITLIPEEIRIQVEPVAGEKLVFTIMRESRVDRMPPFELPASLTGCGFYYKKTAVPFAQVRATGKALLQIMHRGCAASTSDAHCVLHLWENEVGMEGSRD